MTFDGPGQPAGGTVRAGIPFRPDWEAVLIPVLDAMLECLNVDPDRVAVTGVSQAGLLGSQGLTPTAWRPLT
jgi:hypothetical protein